MLPRDIEKEDHMSVKAWSDEQEAELIKALYRRRHERCK